MNTTASLTPGTPASRQVLGEDLLAGVQPLRRRRPQRPWTAPAGEHPEHRAWHETTAGVPVRLNARGRSAVRALRRPAPRDPSPLLGLQVRQWQRFGAGLAHGQGGLDLYFHALGERDRWQGDLARMPRGAAVAISRALAVGDRAFNAATVPDELGLLQRWSWHGGVGSWWWSRVPAHGPLLEQLSRS